MEHVIRNKHTYTHTSYLSSSNSRSVCPLTGEGCISVQLAYTLLQQAEAERQHGRVVEQMEHDAVAGRFVGRELLALQLHHLLDKV